MDVSNFIDENCKEEMEDGKSNCFRGENKIDSEER